MTSLYEWATKWNVPWQAVVDLQRQFGIEGNAQGTNPIHFNDVSKEGRVQSGLRLEAAQKRILLWRNNVGALKREDGDGFVRFGLANDSAAVNARIKSGDLIGIRPVTVNAAMVGHVFGQFVSREVKAPGWHYTDTPREQAQKRWIELVMANGGDACFATGEGTL